MRLLGLLCILISFNSSAVMPWGLCPGTPVTGMIPCDTVCFGPAGLALGQNYVTQEGRLQSEISGNTNLWIKANNEHISYQTSYLSQSNLSNTSRATALDGVSKVVSTSIDKYAVEKARGSEYFVQQYANLKKNIRVQRAVLENGKSYKGAYNSPTGEHLLTEIESYANVNKEQEALLAALEPSKTQEFHLDAKQKAALFFISNSNDSTEANMHRYGGYLTQDVVNQEEWDVVLKALVTLYAFNPKYNGDESEYTKSDGFKLNMKLAQVRNQYALNSLVNSITLSGEESETITYEMSVQNINQANNVSGIIKMLLPHELQSELVFQKAIENNLLHTYLKQSRNKNALKVIAGL